jgi:transcriptional regulator with XRE-family HTH domain
VDTTELSSLASRLRYAREKKGLTQEQLAKKAGTTQQNIQNIEAGLVQRPRKIGAIAKAVDQSPAWLQFGTEAIDKLDADAIALALAWMSLPEPQKSAMKTAIQGMGPKPRRK